MKREGQIGVTTENIFPIIKKFLYSDHEIFLRELISNAQDATTKLLTLSRLGDAPADLGSTTIDVRLDSEAKTLTIRDQGIGMTQEEVEKYINQIAFSGAEEFMSKYKDQNIIGHFGLGFYSAFMVADKVEINTLSYKDGSKAVRWSCDGTPNFSIEKSDKSTRGTEITLHISEDSIEFANKSRIDQLLHKYCAFLPIPIVFGKVEQYKDGKMVQTEEDNIINDTNPLWIQKPSQIVDQQYDDFYKKLYPMADAPLFHIHLNVDYPFNLTGILYFPKIKNNFEIQKNKIQLYCNQVFITDSVEGIVPDFLTLLHGVIDSPDIPLNVSRSYLQSDSNVKKISGHITKKVADRLSEIFKNNPDEYKSKWDDLKLFIQYGIVSDSKFGERADEFTLLKNSDGKYFTLDQYAGVIKDLQTDKNGKIVHLYSNDPVNQYSYIEAAKSKGYDVLIMDSPVEGHFISFLEQKHIDWSFVRVDANVAEKLIEKDTDESIALTSEQQERVTKQIEEVLPKSGANYKVEFAPMSQNGNPIVITQDEFMRRMKEMSKMSGMSFYGEVKESYTLVVNGNSDIIAKVASDADGDNREVMSQLVDLALLSGGLLKGKELETFIARNIKSIK